MALLWMDGFDRMAAGDSLTRRFNQTGGLTFNSGASHTADTGFIVVDGDGQTTCRITPNGMSVASGSVAYFASWVRLPTLPSSGTKYMLGFYGTGTTYISLTMDGSTKRLSARNWGDNATLATEVANPGYFNGKSNAWVHLVVAVAVSDTVGVFKVWLDGVLTINFSGDTNGATVGSITRVNPWWTSGSALTLQFSDIVIWDDSGTDFAPTSLDPHNIRTVSPDGAGASTQFTPSAGSNFQCVDDTGAEDGDSTRVVSATNTHLDLYTYAAIPSEFLEVKAVGVLTWACPTSADGTMQIQNAIRPVSTNYFSSSFTIPTAQYFPQDTYYGKNPETTAQWHPSEVDASQAGFKRIAGAVDLLVTQQYLMVLRATVATFATVAATVGVSMAAQLDVPLPSVSASVGVSMAASVTTRKNSGTIVIVCT